jgi:phosphatidylglycerophosphate synthase
MSPDPATKRDCYSAGERATMEWYQDLRAKLLGPLLSLLTRVGINADHITVVSLVVGLSFCWLWWFAPHWALLAILLHAAIDGLDGPLARFQKTASPRGSFTDTFCDQIIVAASTITLMMQPDAFVDILPGSVYIFVYTLLVALAMVRNALQVPYGWILRPRFIVYLWLAGEVFLFPETSFAHSLNIVVWICNAVMALKVATGFFKIRAQL